MAVVLVVGLVWVVAFIGIYIMKKLQPDDRIYPVWAVMVCILLTIFVGWYVSSLQ